MADFSLFYQARGRAPANGAIAFLWADRPRAAFYTPARDFNFNSTGGFNTVRHDKTGVYRALLPGLTAAGGNPQVTAHGGIAARCEVNDWSVDRVGTTVGVFCVDAAGAPSDKLFSLSYTIGTNAAAGPAATARGAYAFADNAKRANYAPAPRFQFETVSRGPLTAERFGGPVLGQYALAVPNPNNIPFATILGMVTPIGSKGEYCDTTELGVPAGEFDLDLVCVDAAGRQTDRRYTAAFVTSR